MPATWGYRHSIIHGTMIYLDNAATSYPKPPVVAAAMADFLTTSAGNPGRSGHAVAVGAQREVFAVRRQLSALFGARNPERIVFTLNTTDALNMAMWGLLDAGDRVVTTTMEHNSVGRPLRALASRGVNLAFAPCAPDGSLDPDELARIVAAAPTRLVVMTHASNVSGTILPVREAAACAHEHGALILVDAAQTAGVLPIDVVGMGIDLLAFPGHKGLLGPTGTGGLYVAPHVSLRPLRQGGTGTQSENMEQPLELPECLEAGTVNTVGIAGLGAALRYLSERGIDDVRRHEALLTERLVAGLGDIPNLSIHGPAVASEPVAVVSITLPEWEPVDLAAILDSSFGIAVRAGLHCALLAHQTLGTYPGGTVRLSPGPFTTEEDIDAVLSALQALACA